jgi:uncharacterized membrane protein
VDAGPYLGQERCGRDGTPPAQIEADEVKIRVEELSAAAVEGQLDALGQLLLDAHDSGMALGLAAPLSLDGARAAYEDTAARLAPGERLLLGAFDGDELVGAVQLNRSDAGNGRHRAEVRRLVVRADTWFTMPAGIVQPLSGFALAHMAGWPLATPWLAAAMVLYVIAGACWLPVVWLQVRMARTAAADLAAGRPLSPSYARDARRWEALGYPAFAAMLAIFVLMVNKPALWG